jgi:2-keto-4-pentenoate hydratase/2-oxohepta-3-ene-1,7-dioic acid hydratase in catechol pathway
MLNGCFYTGRNLYVAHLDHIGFASKTGDLIFTGTPSGVGPVKIGDHLEAYIGDRKMMDFYVR